MSDDHKRKSDRGSADERSDDDAAHALRRAEKAELALKELKRNFYGGSLFLLITSILAVMGIIEHRDLWIIGGLLGMGVAIKLIPFSEVRKLVRRGD